MTTDGDSAKVICSLSVMAELAASFRAAPNISELVSAPREVRTTIHSSAAVFPAVVAECREECIHCEACCGVGVGLRFGLSGGRLEDSGSEQRWLG